MLIARVDGKSPVEYVTSVKMKNEIRKLSFKLLNKKDISLGNLLNIYSNEFISPIFICKSPPSRKIIL